MAQPSDDIRAKLEQLKQEFAAKAQTDQRQKQAVLNAEQMANKKAKGGTMSQDAMKLAVMKKPKAAVTKVTKKADDRIPELEEAARALLAGEIKRPAYDKILKQHKPVRPYTSVPAPATDDEAMNALMENKRKAWKAHKFEAGDQVGMRLDIPAYQQHGVWVNSLHDESGRKMPTSYAPVSSVRNAVFDAKPSQAQKVATGDTNKSPFAKIKGEWHPIEEQEALAQMQEYLDHPEWHQIGMDPRRRDYFYSRKDSRKPVTNAEHVLQIGPLVLAKNPTFGNRKDFGLAQGGTVKNTFDYENAEHVSNVAGHVAKHKDFKDYDPKLIGEVIGTGSYKHIEDPRIQAAIKKAGHDSYHLKEKTGKKVYPLGHKDGGDIKTKSTEDMRREMSDKYKPTATKASEALGKHEGKHLKVTQADRTKVGDGFLGGPGFSSLQHVDPDYAGAAWGVNTPSAASKIINADKQHPEGESVWSTIIGAPNQHSSNQMVFDMLLKQFKAAIKAGKMTPELRAAFNDKLAAAADNTGKAIFNRGTDIAGKNFFKDLNTFDRRRAVADLMGGKAIGGKKGQIFDYDKIMRNTTEPELLDAPTHAIGPRLFKLSGARSLQPDLHPAFPHILHGEDTGQMYHPVPRDIMLPDFHDMIRKTKGRDVGFMDLTRNTPTQQLTEKFLTQLQKRGYADGGQVSDISQIGAEEAPNMPVKNFVVPSNGAQGPFPMGGVDMSPQSPGQQMLPANAMQPNPLAPQQPQPPAGPAPQGGGNILQMTPQGQKMAALGGAPQGNLPTKMAVGGPVPVNNHPFMSAGQKPLPFMAKVGGSNNMPMNNNYGDNGATDFSIDNIQQLARGGSVSVASMQKQMKSMAQQINKLTDNLDTMRLALTRNTKAK